MRFIPAGAGNTILFATSPAMPTVYPRWRGEHSPSGRNLHRTRGLSPLARGTPAIRVLWPVSPRFIPAGAGNTLTWKPSPAIGPVYPRWRGEHAENYISECYRKRFIPAGAGNTLNTIRPPLKSTVYPRWRGEHDEFRGPVFVKIGLSPLARGTRVEGLYIVVFRRFIPAGAGNTLKLYICSKSPFLLHNKLPTVR